MALPTPLPPEDPLDSADPLIAHTLRAALESYLRGDYHAALERLHDGHALAAGRLDWGPLNAWRQTLDDALRRGAVVTRDAQPLRDVRSV